jgi:predicted transposase YdaD
MSEPGKIDVAHPHDLLVRNILVDTELAADLLRNYIDPGLASTLDLDSLKVESGETVSPHFSELEGDLRYSGRFKGNGGALRVFVLLEHQSRPDRLMSFRMLEYVFAVYRQQIPALQKGKKFPYPLAVVLHHGESPWKKIPSMRDLIDLAPGVPCDILGLPICLIDVAAMSVDKLRGHPMVCALLDSLQSASMGALPERMPGILSRLRDLGGERRVESRVTVLAKYYAAIRGGVKDRLGDFNRVFSGLYNKREAEKMATTMYEAIQREGEAKGLAEGLAKGKAEGKAEGKTESVLTVLELRFGEVPAVLQKKLKNLQDIERIEEITKLAVTSQNLKEFQKAL